MRSQLLNRKEYKYMFERLREKAGNLDEIICKIGEILQEKNSLVDLQPVYQVKTMVDSSIRTWGWRPQLF